MDYRFLMRVAGVAAVILVGVGIVLAQSTSKPVTSWVEDADGSLPIKMIVRVPETRRDWNSIELTIELTNDSALPVDVHARTGVPVRLEIYNAKGDEVDRRRGEEFWSGKQELVRFAAHETKRYEVTISKLDGMPIKVGSYSVKSFFLTRRTVDGVPHICRVVGDKVAVSVGSGAATRPVISPATR